MTTTTPITRPVSTDKPQTPQSGRRTAALVASGVVMLGLAIGTTYAAVSWSTGDEQPQQISNVQGIDRAGADAKAFARGTAETTVTVRGFDRPGADAKAFVRGTAETTDTPVVLGVDRPGADAKAFTRGLTVKSTATVTEPQGTDRQDVDSVQYARTHGLTYQFPAGHSTGTQLPQGHAYLQELANGLTGT